MARIPYRGWLLAVFLLLLGLSLVGATASTLDHTLHHVPTVAFLAWLVSIDRRRPFDGVSYTLLFLFLMTHVVGARYLYSNVPLDVWAQALAGIDLTESLSNSRNHYDRFVHLSFGLLVVRPARQLVAQRAGCQGLAASFFAVLIIVFIGTAYELIEWQVAVMMAPETAEAYNGQQGDVWDPQKDMALALVGAVIAVVMCHAPGRRTRLGVGNR